MPRTLLLVSWIPLALTACVNEATGPVWQALPPSALVSAGSNGYMQVSAGEVHSCAIKLDGTLLCWGSNAQGQSAIRTGLGPVAHVSARYNQTCVIRSDGTVACWGVHHLAGPSPDPTWLGAVKQVSSGRTHTCAVKSDDTPACWGYNGFGAATIPSGVATVKQISAGGFHNCAVKADDTLACWGNNANGETDIPSGLGTVKHVSASNAHTCAIKTDDTVVCWGDSSNGKTTVPSGLGTVKQLSAGNFNHNCAIKADDTVTCWGNFAFVPPPSGLSTVEQVSAGGQHTCAVTTDGTLACWGEDGSGQTTVPISLNNPPTADAAGPYIGAEGALVNFDGTGSSDPDGDALTFEWDFDYDGSIFTVDAVGVTPTYAYPQDGTYTAALRVSDDEDAHTSSALVTIANVLATVIVSGPADPIGLGNGVAQATIAVGFNDPGQLDPHATSVQCGNGVFGAEITAAEYICTYTAAGVYTVTVHVTDDGGAGVGSYQYVVVYDPSGGFATGGGWIEYGAVACPVLCGGHASRADFGFVSKYHKGAKVPTGDTRFVFHAGTLNFASLSYDWLIISGSRAQFKGTGQIDGAGDYGFMLTAVDGQLAGGGGADLFRIRIWDKATSTVVYDNQAGAADDAPLATVLSSGSIVIHVPKK